MTMNIKNDSQVVSSSRSDRQAPVDAEPTFSENPEYDEAVREYERAMTTLYASPSSRDNSQFDTRARRGVPSPLLGNHTPAPPGLAPHGVPRRDMSRFDPVAAPAVAQPRIQQGMSPRRENGGHLDPRVQERIQTQAALNARTHTLGYGRKKPSSPDSAPPPGDTH